MQNIALFTRKYTYVDGTFRPKSGRLAKIPVAEEQVIKDLIEGGAKFAEIPSLIQELKTQCAPTVANVQDSDWDAYAEDEIQKIVDEFDVMGQFRILKGGFKEIDDPDRLLKFREKDDGTVKFIFAGVPRSSEWVNILFQNCNDDLVRMQPLIAPFLNKKRPRSVLKEDIAMEIIKKSAIESRPELIYGDGVKVKSIALSTSKELAYVKIPYEMIPDEEIRLNPTLSEFLSRIPDSEYLCAILWLMFNGVKVMYATYLFGTGGEGKSSFVNILKDNVKSYATFTDASNFSAGQMYGKAMIFLEENTDVYLLQNSTIKRITGESNFHMERKNENATYSRALDGNLIIDSNRMLKLKGDQSEHRRLRLFRVSQPPKDSPHMNAGIYKQRMGERFNDFLNHCRVCYSKVGNGDHLSVGMSPTQARELSTLLDKNFIYSCAAIMRKIKDALKLEMKKEGSLISEVFWKTFYDLDDKKDKYLYDNFKDYMALHLGLVDDGKQIHGIQHKPDAGTIWENPL